MEWSGFLKLQVLKLECRDDRAKSYVYHVNAGVQGEFVVVLCKFCNNIAPTPWMTEWDKVPASTKQRLQL